MEALNKKDDDHKKHMMIAKENQVIYEQDMKERLAKKVSKEREQSELNFK